MACPAKLRRTVKRGMKGGDVLGLKYGLKKAKYGRLLVFSRTFGSAMYYNVRRFQKAHGLHVDGQVGPQTYAALKKYIPPYGCWLINHAHIPAPLTKQQTVVKTALYAAAHAGAIHYTQGPLRMQGVRNKLVPPAFPRWEDCSSFVTWLYWVARIPDPNGLGYNGYGYTGTLVNHGYRVTYPKPGDLVFYGWSNGIPTHVAVYIGNGQVVSHGSESGPKVADVNYRPITSIHRYL